MPCVRRPHRRDVLVEEQRLAAGGEAVHRRVARRAVARRLYAVPAGHDTRQYGVKVLNLTHQTTYSAGSVPARGKHASRLSCPDQILTAALSMGLTRRS